MKNTNYENYLVWKILSMKEKQPVWIPPRRGIHHDQGQTSWTPAPPAFNRLSFEFIIINQNGILKLSVGFILMHWSSQKGMCSWIKFEQLTEYFAKKKVWFACVHKIDCDLSVEHSLIKKVILTGFNERWLGSVEVICQMWHAHYAEHSLFNQL